MPSTCTYGEFLDELSDNGERSNFHLTLFLAGQGNQEFNHLTDKSQGLTRELVIRFSDRLANHMQKSLGNVSSETIHSKLLEEAHECLQKISRLACAAGLNLEDYRVDRPLTPAEIEKDRQVRYANEVGIR
jgi:hypothetical protein